MGAKVGLGHTVDAAEAALHEARVVAEATFDVFVVGSALAAAGGHADEG